MKRMVGAFPEGGLIFIS